MELQLTNKPGSPRPAPLQRADATSPLALALNAGPRARSLSARGATLNAAPGVVAQAKLASDLSAPRPPNRTGLPDAIKSGVEELSGMALDDVRVHYNSPSAAPLQAAAYTQGNNIHVAPGQQQHLAHEAWHVVQQKQGRVRSIAEIGGQPLNDDPQLEHEADVMGAQALQRHASAAAQYATPAAPLQRVVQRAPQKMQTIGITHPVRMTQGGSIFEGEEVAQLQPRDVVVIDNAVKYMSARGPNHMEGADYGAQGFLWYQVISINGVRADPNVFIRDDMIKALGPEEEPPEVGPWLIFGTDGQTRDAMASAVNEGYRRFDTAEAYGGRTQELAQVLAASRLPRSAYEIIYKFDVRNDESAQSLYNRLIAVANLFGSRIDSLLIHNTDLNRQTMTRAWDVMLQLKKIGAVKEIGLGNVRAEHADVIGGLKQRGNIDAVENSVFSVLTEEDTKALIMNTGAKVYYYDVARTAAKLTGPNGPIPENKDRKDNKDGKGEKDRPRDANPAIDDLIYFMGLVNSGSAMILSSASAGHQRENLATYGKGENTKGFDAGGRGKYLTVRSLERLGACTENEDAPPLPKTDMAILETLSGKTLANARAKLTEEARGQTITAVDIARFLGLNRESLLFMVPERIGLSRKYTGMTLGAVLVALFGPSSCNWKWSNELIYTFTFTVEQWMLIGPSLSEIVPPTKK